MKCIDCGRELKLLGGLSNKEWQYICHINTAIEDSSVALTEMPVRYLTKEGNVYSLVYDALTTSAKANLELKHTYAKIAERYNVPVEDVTVIDSFAYVHIGE